MDARQDKPKTEQASVGEQLERIDNEISYITDSIARLINRLTVLLPAAEPNPAGGNDNMPTTAQAQSPMVLHVTDLADRVQSLNGTVCYLEQNLQI